MTQPRDRILERLAALQRPTPGAPTAGAPPRPEAAREVDREKGLVERFLSALTAAGVTWELADSIVGARLALVSRLQEHGITRLLSWEAEDLPVPGLLEALEVMGFQVVVPRLRQPGRPGDPRGVTAWRETLADVEAMELGITGADAAIAEDGLFVLSSGPGRPRVVAQLPRRHMVLLPLSRLYPTVGDWLKALRSEGAVQVPTSWASLSLIAGPSKADDIELETALGLHGPRTMHAILVEDRTG